VTIAKRSAELLKHGTWCSLASRKMVIASASEPAIGLSMNTGFRAAKTGRACARCGRPSMLRIITASDLAITFSMESTISTPSLRIGSTDLLRISMLIGTSRLPPG